MWFHCSSSISICMNFQDCFSRSGSDADTDLFMCIIISASQAILKDFARVKVCVIFSQLDSSFTGVLSWELGPFPARLVFFCFQARLVFSSLQNRDKYFFTHSRVYKGHILHEMFLWTSCCYSDCENKHLPCKWKDLLLASASMQLVFLLLFLCHCLFKTSRKWDLMQCSGIIKTIFAFSNYPEYRCILLLSHLLLISRRYFTATVLAGRIPQNVAT